MRLGGLGARFALLLTAALLAASLAALAIFAVERSRTESEGLRARDVARVLALLPALDGAGPIERRRIVRAASNRAASVGVAPLPAVADGEARATAFVARIAAAPDRDIRAAQRRARSGRDRLVISVALEDPPGWLNAEVRGGRPDPRLTGAQAFLVVQGLTLLAVLGVGLLFIRRLTDPLAALASAARAAGRGDHAVRVPEAGADELREAARAFNDMQSRIGAFEAERMRTVASVGHDLRTPITSLRIRAEMIEDEVRSDMIRTLGEMEVMADGLVAYARGQTAEAREQIDLAALLARVCEAHGAALDAEPAATLGRPVALSRAFGNLVGNAVRYGGAAHVTLRTEGGGAVVTVTDEGPGIPEDRLASVMEPFVRGEASRSGETGGAGLGLSIARDAIRAHGGTLTLENGATGLIATVTIPIRKPERSD